MLLRPSTLFSLSSLLSLALSQASIPSDLTSNFDPSAISLQVSFTGDASEGFSDGSTISSQEASNTPSFALGDASGVNTAISFLVLMVDTTDSSNVQLHYLQTDFKAGGDETQIASSTGALLSYQPPGSFGETGTRNYVFLMYQQLQGSVSGLPNKGDSFDISSFQSTNGLKGAEAGVAMAVDLGGENGNSNNNGGNNNQPQQTSSDSGSSQQQQTTEAASSTQESQPSQTQQTTFETSTAAAASSDSTSSPPPSSTTSSQTTLQSSTTNPTTNTEPSTATVLPTAAASVGAVGAGPVGGVVSSIDASLSGSGIVEPTGVAGASSSSTAVSVATGAAVPLRVGRLEVLGAVVVVGLLL